MSEMSFYDMNKCLCKELCCEFKKFEEDKNIAILKGIKALLESMVYLNELEAAGAMRQYFEDEHGYDSRTSEFREQAYPRFGIYNNAPTYTNPNPMYRGDMDGMREGRDGGTRRNMDGREYGRGYDDNDRMIDRRDMNRGRDMRSVYNMANAEDMKKKDKLTPQEIQKWMDSLESDSGERGPMWSKEEIESVAKKEGIKFDEFTPEELWAATNIMYSDYCSTGEAFNIDKPSFYISLAKNFLVDPDAVGEGGEKKLAAYYEYVVEH